jgi:hypothetical protein
MRFVCRNSSVLIVFRALSERFEKIFEGLSHAISVFLVGARRDTRPQRFLTVPQPWGDGKQNARGVRDAHTGMHA